MSTNGWFILGLLLWAVVETMREYQLTPGRPLLMAAGAVCLLVVLAAFRSSGGRGGR